MSDPQLLYTDVEDDLRSSVRGVLEKRCSTDRVNACYDGDDAVGDEVWRALADQLGLAGLLVPEELGGAGASAREAGAVLEELGRYAVPVPFLSSAVVATVTAVAAGDHDLARRLAEGGTTAALLVPASARTVGDSFTLDAHGRLSGALRGVLGVAGPVPAGVLLVPADGGLRRVEVAADGVSVTAVLSLDMTQPLADVHLDGVASTAVTDDLSAADAGLLAGATLLASEQVGIAGWCLEETVAYLQQRRQFGRVVGGFQALKHRLADLYAEVESARAAARYAVATLADDDPDAAVAASLAQAYCSRVAVHAAEEAVQLHGGIGMTWEHGAHLRLKRAKADQVILGSPEAHLAALATLIDLPATG